MKSIFRFFCACFIFSAAAAFAIDDSSKSVNALNASISVDIPVKTVSLLDNYDILAYYGRPKVPGMGILGRLPINELYKQLSAEAENYKAVSGGKEIKKAFYIIYGTALADPPGGIGYVGKDTLLEWINFAEKNDMLVFLDHQIGKYDPIDSLKRMLPYLKYPNVHLALDPEWRTTKPNEVIGSVTAEELNRAQQVMEEYIVQNNIEGERLLVIHQFKPRMIVDRKNVRADFEYVRLVHCADGFGNPTQKREAYAANAQAANMPIKAFKLFYKSEFPNAGYDSPLLTPAEVYSLEPRPQVIMYQ